MKTNNTLKIGSKITTFSCISLLDGLSVNISQINKPALINFWSTNCFYSTNELVSIDKVKNIYNDKVDFFLINCGDSIEVVKEYLNRNKTKMMLKNLKLQNIFIDYNDYITDLLNITDIPTSIIIDENLMINYTLIGKNKVSKYLSCLNFLTTNKIK